jgi:glucose/arabinose dehydrogenase
MKLLRAIVLVLGLAVLAACAANSPASTETNTPVQEAGAATDTPFSIIPASATPSPTTEPTATPLPERTIPDPTGYGWVQVASGFSRPLLLTHAGDGSGRVFVLEQDGRIQIMQDGAPLEQPFLDIVELVGSESNEQGLLGLAFHPDYEQNGRFFINYTDTAGDTVIARYQVSSDPNVADPNSEVVLMAFDQPYPNHNGGHLAFGPDGYLYIGSGDGGSQGDPERNGQSLETYLGKILRLDVNAAEPYAIPVENPFGRGGGLGEIWAYGLRNPWRFSFDRATGDMYVADVGQGQIEEISWLPGGIAGGANFGWNLYEGTRLYEGNGDPTGLTMPVAEYRHDETGGCSVTGGYVYRGAMLPAWVGVYVYGDFCSGEIWGLVQHSDGSWENQPLFNTSFFITSFGEDEAGELYLVDRNGGVYQLQAQ